MTKFYNNLLHGIAKSARPVSIALGSEKSKVNND